MDQVTDWLTLYNHRLLHSTLGYVSSMQLERARRMVLAMGHGNRGQGHMERAPGRVSAVWPIAGKIGCTAETLRKWVRQGERDSFLARLRAGSPRPLPVARPSRISC